MIFAKKSIILYNTEYCIPETLSTFLDRTMQKH